MSNFPFTLDQLKILQMIVRENSFRQAAEKLYISQPAVSLQVQNLEKQLNTSIFYRNRRKAYLTESGQVLKQYCDKILQLCEETCHALEELQTMHSGLLVLGSTQTIGTYLVPRLIGMVHQKYPQLNIDLKIQSTSHVLANIQTGKLDLAIIGGNLPKELNSSLEIITYAEDEVVLILPTTHPFASLDYLQKEDLYRLRFITLQPKSSTMRKLVERTLTKNGIDIKYFKIEMELNSIEAIKNAVQSGLGAAFVSVSSISKELELGMLHWAKVDGLTIKRTLYIITNPSHYNSSKTTFLKNELLSMFFISQSSVIKT